MKTDEMPQGHCDCGDRCSCPPGSVQRAACTCWHLPTEKAIKVYGLLAFSKQQEPLIQKHCFGDCGKVSIAGVIMDDTAGGFWVCCEEKCPWLDKQMDEVYGTTMSWGKPHDIYVRTITDTPVATQG